MRIATIDIGTNSTRLLIAEVKNGEVEPLYKTGKVTRLGQGVKQTGYLSRDSIERTIAVLEEFKKKIEEFGVEKVVAVTTEAARLAKNADEFLNKVKALGIEIKILSDREEAELVYIANVSHFKPLVPAVTVDLGGGSTEIAYGKGENLIYYESLKFGVVVLLEKFIKSDPPAKEELLSLEVFIEEQLKGFKNRAGIELPFEVFGVGGTITSVVAMEEAMTVYDSEKVHGYQVTCELIDKWYRRVSSVSVEERKKIVGLEEGRADVIVPGLAFFKVFCEVFGIEKITVSELGLLYGLALREAKKCQKR
ncbi:Ppx/GppA phosphatase family protein [Desulfurobacterium indicum]|uniref:Phosphatase n=1 Tax=Desulfurobacterium indicum TaxID=1914305 RepID=A0A1R1MNQ3_9BACT|nr:Ppx/GppA phosphatase family protein [Desulfurobacterium indicum]OMH41379.1 phosphatase [Desulfurobacterium indicum]